MYLPKAAPAYKAYVFGRAAPRPRVAAPRHVSYSHWNSRGVSPAACDVHRWAASSMVEQLTLNQRVGGSSPPRLTTFSITYDDFQDFLLATVAETVAGAGLFMLASAPVLLPSAFFSFTK